MMSDPLTGFLMGMLLGYLMISCLLKIRAIAVVLAGAAALALFYQFYLGGSDAVIAEVERFRALLGSSQDMVDGALVGKLLSGAIHSINRKS